MTACVCGSGRTTADCCARLHAGEPAATPEALMRSRYSAHVFGLKDYLLATWHPATRPATMAANEAGLKWLGLDVRRCIMQDADHGIVEFVARSKLGGRASRLHETSRFVREDGQWFYVDGEFGR
jgi:SEC-C motif-containing protein